MPIDINLLRVDKGGDVEAVKASQKKRFASVDLVDHVIHLDEQWKILQSQWQDIRTEINLLQNEIVKKQKAREDASNMIKKKKELSIQEVTLKKTVDEAKNTLDSELAKIGNIVDPSVPVSSNEDDNTIVSQWGKPIDAEGLLYHHAVLHRIDGYEPEKGVQVAGHRGYFLKGMAVLLNQAIINYSMQFLTKKSYTLLQPPYFMNKSVMSGVAQLEDFDEQLYKVIGEDEKYLIATSEQPICAYHKNEWITESTLPLKYAGYSTCFRKESGAHGKDTWGIFRVHQFDKIEQFCIAEPEKSQALQEEMLKVAEEFYQSLNLPYRVVNIVSGELNNAASKKYDLEAWFPAYKEYRELVSCSNCTDYQSRAMEIRCGIKKMNQMGKKYVHMLNSTLCATSRTLSCIIENYQEEHGVRIPEVLVPFMGGVTFIPFAREEKVNLQAIKMKKAKEKKK